MKALVMDIRDQEAAVLDQDGVFRIVENKGYEIGQQIEVEGSLVEKDYNSTQDNVIPFPQKRYFGIKRVVAAGLALILIGGIASFAIPSARIQAKGNSSVTYKMNIWDRVIGIDGNDQTGKEIADQIDLGFSGKPIDEVMEKTLDLMEEQAADGDMGDVQFTTQSPFNSQEKRTQKHLEKYQKEWENRKERREKQKAPNIDDPDKQGNGSQPSDSDDMNRNKDGKDTTNPKKQEKESQPGGSENNEGKKKQAPDKDGNGNSDTGEGKNSKNGKNDNRSPDAGKGKDGKKDKNGDQPSDNGKGKNSKDGKQPSGTGEGQNSTNGKQPSGTGDGQNGTNGKDGGQPSEGGNVKNDKDSNEPSDPLSNKNDK